MSRTGFLILVGVLTILTPLSGLPVAIRSELTVVLGVCVLAIGLSLRSQEAQAHSVQQEAKLEEKPKEMTTIG